MSTSTRSVRFVKTRGDLSGRIEIRFDGDTNVLTQVFELRHRDGTVIRDELGFDGKSYSILATVESIFDSPAVFRGKADVVSDDTVAFRGCEWMDTPVPDFREQLGGCAVIPADVPVHEIFRDWKPGKKTRLKNVTSVEAFAAFMTEWREDLLQEMAVTSPPDSGEGGKNPISPPSLITYLMCLSSCYGMYTTMLGVVAVGLSASTANPAAAVAAMAAAMATLLVALLQCEMACSGLYWHYQVKPRL